MSKAFVRDSDATPEPVGSAPVSPLPAGSPNYLTPSGASRLRDELRLLRETERPSLVARGNADPEAKLKLAALDQRIRHLQLSLLTAKIAQFTPGPADVVRFGATVIVRESDGAVMQYRLVGVDETDAARGAISWISPLGQALLNSRVGARVNVPTPLGTKTVVVVSIRYDEE